MTGVQTCALPISATLVLIAPVPDHNTDPRLDLSAADKITVVTLDRHHADKCLDMAATLVLIVAVPDHNTDPRSDLSAADKNTVVTLARHHVDQCPDTAATLVLIAPVPDHNTDPRSDLSAADNNTDATLDRRHTDQCLDMAATLVLIAPVPDHNTVPRSDRHVAERDAVLNPLHKIMDAVAPVRVATNEAATKLARSMRDRVGNQVSLVVAVDHKHEVRNSELTAKPTPIRSAFDASEVGGAVPTAIEQISRPRT